ncbi:MAG: TauD/TfdA dioxygenase family protein [Burkholderiaceae bacterium]
MFRIETRKISEAVGADILNIDIRQPLSGEQRQALLDAWAEFLVLRFRDQPLTDPQLIDFSRNLGELDPPGPNPQGKPYLPEFPELNVISNIKQNGQAIGGLGDGEAIWHADMTYMNSVPIGAVLHGIEVPAEGGNTYWSNNYLAFSTLPAALKKAIEGKKAVHDSTYNSAGIMRIGMQPVTDVTKAPGAQHALVVHHPRNGKELLFLGRRRNSYIVGMPVDESEALLDELWAHATRPEFTMTQQWQRGDTIIWDNFATLHRRDSFDPNTRRLMHRAQIKGFTPQPARIAA